MIAFFPISIFITPYFFGDPSAVPGPQFGHRRALSKPHATIVSQRAGHLQNKGSPLVSCSLTLCGLRRARGVALTRGGAECGTVPSSAARVFIVSELGSDAGSPHRPESSTARTESSEDAEEREEGRTTGR